MNGPGLRYEVAVSIQDGDIVWVNGPFKPGIYNDLMIFWSGLKKQLATGERVIADDGYRGEPGTIVLPISGKFRLSTSALTLRKKIRSRHETANKRFKDWGALCDEFWHDNSKHGIVFHAVAVIIQLHIESGQPLFNLEEAYDDAPMFRQPRTFPRPPWLLVMF